MTFPVEIAATVQLPGNTHNRTLHLYGGITTILGPNGSGKTQLMRAAKAGLQQLMGRAGPNGAPPINKKVRFVSAGRMGMLEQYRSDFNGQYGTPQYDNARYGSKNDSSRRHKYETLQGDILTLSQRPDILVKIRERLRKLFQRDIFLEWDAGSLKLSFSRLNNANSVYSSGREASGLMHLVGLLTSLFDDEVGALVIDEPEVSLHPQLQAFLLQVMADVAGYPEAGSNKKIILISTHSTEFIKLDSPNDIPRLVFCSEFGVPPVQVSPDVGELRNRKVRELVSRMGQEHKLSLFANSPVLVEGPSDAVICGAVATRLKIHLEAGGAQVLPVIGKGEFPVVLKIFRMMGKNPVVLADCDGLADGTELINSFLCTEEGNEAATKRGFGSGLELSRNVYGDFCSLIERGWSEIERVAQEHSYFVDSDLGDDDVRRRRSGLAAMLSLSLPDLKQLPKPWSEIRTRLEVLLDVLEELGCFILRRGTIEEYYTGTNIKDFTTKPDAAVNESLNIQELDHSTVEQAFADVARCLRSASSAKTLNEGESLRDLLLSCVAPLQARMREGSNRGDPNQLVRAFLGESAQLFTFSWQGDALRVELNSKIIEVQGFPILVGLKDDAAEVCSRILLNR